MPSYIYAPNIHLFAFHRKEHHPSNSTVPYNKSLLWEKCNEIFDSKFGVTKRLVIEDREGYRVDLYKDKSKEDVALQFEGKVNSPDKSLSVITGVALPVRIHDTYALALNLRRPEKENDKETKPVPLSFLQLLNPSGCLIPQNFGSSLGQTLLLTIEEKKWFPLKLSPNQQELRKLADESLKEFIADEFTIPEFYQNGELFGSPIFEYGNSFESDTYCHIILWIYCKAETRDKFENNYSNFLNLFCYRNKVISAYRNSQRIKQVVYQEYIEIDPYIDKIFKEMPVSKSLNEAELNQFKKYLKDIPQKHLEYSRYIRDLNNYRLNVEHNAQNYQQELRDIKSRLPLDNFSFLESFLEQECRLFREQIQADLDYFGHGSDLLEKALNAIRGRVEIEQAERDRNLQKTIQAVGFSIGAAGIVATSAPYWIKQNPEEIVINKPFTSRSLNTFSLVLLLSFFVGLATWVIISVMMNGKNWIAGVKHWFPSKIGNKKNQASLASSPNQTVQITSGQKEPEQKSISQNN